MKELNYIASVSAPRALGTCALTRLAQMGGFVQLTPESYNPPKLPIDTMTSASHGGGCVLVEPPPTLRWPAKSESPALLPAKRKPVDGEPFDSDPRQRDQDRRRRRTTRAARSLPARAGWPDWNAHRLRHVAMWCVHRAVRRSYGQILHGAGSAGRRSCRHDDRRFG